MKFPLLAVTAVALITVPAAAKQPAKPAAQYDCAKKGNANKPACQAVAPAAPSSTDDGTAGLAALNGGAYGDAVRLFTRAIAAGDLPPDDQEFAYLSRAKAYQGLGNTQAAITDLQNAVHLQPSDTEAQQLLQSLTGASSGDGAGHLKKKSKKAAAGQPEEVGEAAASPWGPLAVLPGAAWMEVGKTPDFYVQFSLDPSGRSITYNGLDRAGNPITGAYQLDPASGKIVGQTSYGGRIASFTIEMDGNRFAEEGTTRNGVPSRDIYTPITPTSFEIVAQAQQNGAWNTVRTVKFVQVSQDMIDALGWKVAKKSASKGFWGDLGDALVQGAAAGIVSGLQPKQ